MPALPFIPPLSAGAVAASLLCGSLCRPVLAQPSDPRVREVWYDPKAVITVPVKRGVITQIQLDAGEAITDVGAGLGSDCARPDASWCIAAQPGGRNIFVKPKSSANAPNNLAVVTDQRSHAFRFIVLPDGDPRPAVFRLTVKVPAPRALSFARGGYGLATTSPASPASPIAPVQFNGAPRVSGPASPAEVITQRLAAAPTPVNSNYSLAEGKHSQDIVPTLIFDDGRFTYLRFPNNREVPAVFQVQGDGSEAVTNTRMEGDLLVVDRVSRRLMLRAGSAVVGVWNDAFDVDGVPPSGGTTVAGVVRALKSQDSPRPEPDFSAPAQGNPSVEARPESAEPSLGITP